MPSRWRFPCLDGAFPRRLFFDLGVQKLTRSSLKGVWGPLKDKFAFFEALFSFKSPIPETRKAACKTPIFYKKKAECFKMPFKLDRVSFSAPDFCAGGLDSSARPGDRNIGRSMILVSGDFLGLFHPAADQQDPYKRRDATSRCNKTKLCISAT